MSRSTGPQQRQWRLVTLDSPDDLLVYDLVQLAHADNSFEVRFCDPKILAKLVNEDRDTVFLSVIDDVQKLKGLVHIFRSILKKPLKSGKLFALALNRLSHNGVPRILTHMGFTEVASSQSLKADGLKLRIEELFGRFLAIDENMAPSKPQQKTHESSLVIRECRLKLLDPLVTPSDCWLLRRQEDIRIVNDQWIIDLVGPGPSAGKWVRTEPNAGRSSDGHASWKWEAARKNTDFVKENGLWVFEGRRPHFNEYHWTFTSRAPKLSYFEQDKPVCDYFAIGPDKTLHIATNSDIAQQKWPAIRASVLNEYHYTVEAPRIETPNWKFVLENEHQIPWRKLMGVDSSAASSSSRQQMMREIQAKTSPLADLFSKVGDEELRNSLVQEMSKRQCSALVWTTGQRIRFGAKIRDSKNNLQALLIEIPAGLTSAELLDVLRVDGSKLFVNVSLERGGVFFVAEEVTLRETMIEVVLPKILYQVQRRSHFRLSISEERGMFIRIGDQFHRMTNLSGGGAGFITDATNQAVFAKGTILPRVSFQIFDEKINAKAEVRWSKLNPDAPPGAELSVGIQFINARLTDEQKLNLYVLEEGFEYFRQHVLSNS